MPERLVGAAKECVEAATKTPDWVAYVQAFSAPLIAVFVAYIAYRQWQTARAKLAVDLFERRSAVYRSVRSAVSVVNTHAKVTREAEQDLLQAKEEAEFLFGPEVLTYLERMWNDFIQLNLVNSMIRSGEPGKRGELVRKHLDLCNRITNFYYEGADVFSPYMKLADRVGPIVERRRQRPRSPSTEVPESTEGGSRMICVSHLVAIVAAR